jgi:protease-4
MKTRTVIISLVVAVMLVGGAFLLGAFLAFISHSLKGSRSIWSSGDIGLVRIEGGLYQSQNIIEQLEDFRRDKSIKAIILRINSPGGSVAASQEIYRAAKKASEDKPVIASMETVAASGGYYAALGATHIFANPGTITGSIGVRLDHVMLRELLDWAKIRYETLKSGRFKDMGSFDRPLTPEEKTLLQDMLDDIHAQFKEAVVQERKLDPRAVEKLADGRVFTGRQALDVKLVDELGGLIEVIERAKELGGIKGEPDIVEHKKFRYQWLKGALENTLGLFAERFSDTALKRTVLLPLYEASVVNSH